MRFTFASVVILVASVLATQSEQDGQDKNPIRTNKTHTFTCDVMCGPTVQSFSGSSPDSCGAARYASGVDDYIATCQSNGDFPIISGEDCDVTEFRRGEKKQQRTTNDSAGVARHRYRYDDGEEAYTVILPPKNTPVATQHAADMLLHTYYGLDMGADPGDPPNSILWEGGSVNTGWLAIEIVTEGNVLTEYRGWGRTKAAATAALRDDPDPTRVYHLACDKRRFGRMVPSTRTVNSYTSTRWSDGRSKDRKVERRRARRRAQGDAAARSRS